MQVWRTASLPYLLILPALLFLLVFFVYPLAQAFLVAFQSPQGEVTLQHFQRMWRDINFQPAVRNTFLLIVLIVPLQLVLALIIALLVHSRFWGASAFLYVCAIPLGISDLAAGIVWLSIFAERGYLNSILQGLGLVDSPFLYLSYQHPEWLFTAIILTEVWRATAIVMIVLVAGLQMIPRDYLEAAELCGAGPFQRIWYVILPLLKPSLQTALIIRTIFAFEVFAVVLVLAGRLIPVLAGESFFWYMDYRNTHMAAAYAVLIMVLSTLVTWLYLKLLRPREELLA